MPSILGRSVFGRLGMLTIFGALAATACSSSSNDTDHSAATTGAGGETSGTGGSDAGGAGGGGGATPSGSPISAPADQWTWVDFPESKCAAGTPTGLAINPHAGSDDLLIYFQGGGACEDATSCWGSKTEAVNLNGYDASTFAKLGPPDFPLLDRGNAGNPFQSINMVFVPYCTGDMHAGTKEVDMQVNGATKPTYFWGAKDLAMFLERLVPTFPNAKHVWLLGASAGGFGTFLSFDRVANAFDTRVDIIDDSGPPLTSAANVNPDLGVWGYEPPGNCASCKSYPDILAAARQRQPSSRVGFLLFERDTTISARYKLTLDEYATDIDAFVSGLSDPNMAAYLVKNEESHVVEKDPSLAAGYLPWIQQMTTDDPAWKSATYTHP